MRISDNLAGTSAAESGRAQETQAAERGSSSSRSSSGATATGDHVEFSGTLGSLSRALSASDASHTARVQALAAQYQAGTYRPDSLATSRGMVSEALSSGSNGALG